MMKKNIVKKEKIEFYAPRREWREFPKGKSGIVFCKNCGAAYYKKSWHHSLRGYKNLKEDSAVSFSLCPACEMIKNRQFEGRVVVEKIPPESLGGLTRLIESFCRRAYEKDPMDRLIKIRKIKSDVLEITVTENQLAVKLAKKIKDVYKKTESKISYSKTPSDVVYIEMNFKQK